MASTARDISLRWLPVIPFGTYALSYLYLSAYHGKFWLWNTVVHEGGTLTLLEVVFYASHFLGHIPSLTVIAMLFAGILLSTTDPSAYRGSAGKLTLAVFALLGISFILSLIEFGEIETMEFLLQRRQSVVRLEDGGSWLLHLPSTLLLFALTPVYIRIVLRISKRKVIHTLSGVKWIAASFGLVVLVTMMVCSEFSNAVLKALSDPRYLAHGVREMLTFPLTYFPIPLYFILRNVPAVASFSKTSSRERWVLIVCAVVSVFGASYMAFVPLQIGINDLAQQPGFAKSGELSIAYLLASHYFEHVLDSIYFTLLLLIFVSIDRDKKRIG